MRVEELWDSGLAIHLKWMDISTRAHLSYAVSRNDDQEILYQFYNINWKNELRQY